MAKVFITRRIPREGIELLASKHEVQVWEGNGSPTREQLIQKLKDVDAVICLLSDRFDSGLMDAAPRLSIISNYAVGYDNIDIKAATERGIMVTNTPGVLTEATADLTFALLLSAARRILEGYCLVKSGRWTGWEPMQLLGADVYGATLGIIGMGRIGAAVARRVRGFDMTVLYYSRSRKPELEAALGIKFCSLEELLRRADFVSIHTPLTPETKGLIGSKEFALMKPNCILVNTSRGPVVDSKALYAALREKRIAGAGLDVFDVEPLPVDDPLLALDNVVLTPHIGSASVQTRRNMAILAAQNVLEALDGNVPACLVNREVLDKIRPNNFPGNICRKWIPTFERKD